MPTARSQAWRRCLLFTSPTAHLLSLLITSVGLGLLFMLVVGSNASTVRMNSELKSIFTGEPEPDHLRQIRFDCRTDHGLDIKLGAIREALVDHLAPNFDRMARGNSYRGNYKSIDFKEPEKKSREYYREYTRLLEHSMGPTYMPGFADWSVVSTGVIYTCLLTTIYINMFLFTMYDLCLSLIELRMKLNICTVIMKYYEAKKRLDFRDSYKGNKFDCFNFNAKPLPLLPVDSTSPSSSSSTSNDRTQVVSPVYPIGRNHFKPPMHSLLYPVDDGSNQDKLVKNQDTVGATQTRNNQTMTSECNIKLLQVFGYLVASRSVKKKLCTDYASRLIDLDLVDSTAPRRATEKFLTSTYLDFRLFQDQIDDCRKSMNFLISYTVFHSLNMIGSSSYMDVVGIRIGLIIAGTWIANITLIGASFFQSQCSKLHPPIYSILAASVRGDKTVRHLALLWRRLLTDLAGARSKFSLRVYSLNISYATTLQVSLLNIHNENNEMKSIHNRNTTNTD